MLQSMGLQIVGYNWVTEQQSEESACNEGDPDFIPKLERSSGKRNGNPFQYSCLENPMDREAWWATIHVVAKFGDNLAIKPPTQEVVWKRQNIILGTVLCYCSQQS